MQFQKQTIYMYYIHVYTCMYMYVYTLYYVGVSTFSTVENLERLYNIVSPRDA